jgi:hypothetical protein
MTHWNDSGYGSPGSPISEGFNIFANNGELINIKRSQSVDLIVNIDNGVHEARNRENMNGISLDRDGNYRPKSTQPGQPGLVQHILSAIDPALTDSKGKP